MAEIQAISPVLRPEAEYLPFAVAALDERLAGGGLASAALHEFAGQTASMGDDAAASLFAAGIASRASTADILWIMASPDLFAPGLASAGIVSGQNPPHSHDFAIW